MVPEKVTSEKSCGLEVFGGALPQESKERDGGVPEFGNYRNKAAPLLQ